MSLVLIAENGIDVNMPATYDDPPRVGFVIMWLMLYYMYRKRTFIRV